MSGKKEKAALSIDPQYVGHIAGVLMAVCAVTALLLGAVNQITAPRIEAIQKAKKEAAMSQVLPADEYVPWTEELPGDDRITGLYWANTGSAGNRWVVEVKVPGSQGTITMMVGIDDSDPMAKAKVTGVSIVSHSETPNIGTKVVGDQAVLDRFIGMSHEGGEITVNAGANRFDGVSGATVSSKGAAAGVNAALDAIADLNVRSS